MFGVVGVVLFLVVSLLMFLIYLSRQTISLIQKALSFESKTGEDNVEDAGDEVRVEISDGETEVVDNDGEGEAGTETEFEIDIDADDDEEEGGEPEGDVVVVVDDAPVADEDSDLELAKKFDEIAGGTTEGETVEGVDGELSMEVEAADGDNDMGGDMLRPINPKDELSYYKPPTLDLLDEYEQGVHSIDKDEQAENANNIVKALKNFGIEISSIKATVGPTITLYEITPAPGVRISKIRNLEDDIAMSLSALCIRIVAPIPGKGTIGIEVPNAHKQIVPMMSLLNSRKYKETDMALPLALGKTISNEVYMVDMAKMPHLLVAGATGMGKSVGLNAIITSLLYKMHPAYLKFVMVDPKMVELSLYSVLEKHFLAKLEGEDDPIITDVNKVVRTLKSLCVEMDNRYKLLQMASVRSVKEYNEKYLNKELLPTKGHRFMPYIVVIIDEYGDLMMTAGREVEQPIARIAQKARAVGIHMIIATQRPTTNIITGTIKANFPARMAFRVISTIDSRTILDRSGANQLQGRGDMLFLAGNDPVRVQCALVETKEVERVCAHIARQQGYQTAYILPEPDEAADFGDGGGGSARGDISPDKLDPLFADAARVVVLAQHGSTSLIQRKLEIGFNRAGRIMDQLCRMGIVGEQEGSKPRQVLCADEADLEFRLKSMM
ncbi:MAG: DNA translocase FtsK [Bacteroidaceae bacterium]|nr:DNA translocase FtsK [Bacteroidaceae bacterium]